MPAKSAYKPAFAEQARKLCRLGATEDDLADFFGQCTRTIYGWKQKHPAFLAAITEAKEEADAKVVKSLYQRALGYSHKAVKFFQHEGKILKEEYIEHYPPDTTACIYWTKNRMPREWRDRQEVEHGVTKDLAESLAAARKRANGSR